MIPLNRVRSTEAIPAKYRDKGKLRADKRLLLALLKNLDGTASTVEFSEAYWKDAKAQLKQESHDKCAYCEANTAVVAHGDVEHYRPKSEYWWLAYTYDNYLYACQVCNQTYKSNNFPRGGPQVPAPVIPLGATAITIVSLVGKLSPDPFDTGQGFLLDDFVAAHLAEKPHLLNPYLDNPDTYFAYEASRSGCVGKNAETISIFP